MGDQQKAAICGSGPPSSLPKWLIKTHARYDADDVAFTPPSEDGSHFFSLHVAVPDESSHASPLHKSTYDQINEELGYAELPNSSLGGRRLSVGGRVSSPRRTSGLCLSTELLRDSQDQRIENLTSEDQHRYQVKPLLVIPRIFSQDSGKCLPDSQNQNTQNQLLQSHKEQNTENERAPSESSLGSPHAHRSPVVSRGASPSRELKAEDTSYSAGILESVRNLFYNKSSSEIQSRLGISPQNNRKISCPQFSGQVPDEVAREETQYMSTQGLVVERRMPSYNSFFYRPGDAGSQVAKADSNVQASVPQASGGVPVQPSNTAATQLQMAAAEVAAAPSVSAKPRRPKPSQLREMNFWAPTSM
ncbi:uncharacterized protein LOC108664696 [Hyalella azteca]|uniref:Uncharacterized protein LOC108664696 n=1 Tax=Hyalella azteca TaxID=294128 RepID=A0A8B7MZZ5_HYAAZ|nr:uncharacterized protein LOC108664696 [Hyalella azteca]